MSIGLFIGRFQPIHLGHISAIEQLLERGVDRIVIGIGSSNAKPSQKNPFSISDRKEMVRKSLDLHFPNHMIELVEIPDVGQDKEWTDYIMETIQPSVIMSGNPWTRECFADRGVEIIEPLFDQKISATEIRTAWCEGKLSSIEKFLDSHIVEFLDHHTYNG